jgi:hypothetical protein
MRKFLSFIVICCIAFIAFFFQNCSSAKFGTVDDSSFATGDDSIVAERQVNINLAFDKISNSNPIKVLVVVDNSGTMENSQQNLARNINYLLNTVQDFESEILLLTTDCNCLVRNSSTTTQPATSAGPATTTTVSEVSFPQNLPKFKFSKNQTAAQKTAELEKISTAIRNLGTQGSQQEMPLRSIVLALENSQLFKKGDNALIYAITDEDDMNSQNVLNTLVKYSKEVKTVRIATGTTTNSYPGFTYRRQYYASFYKEITTTPVYNDQGQQIGVNQNVMEVRDQHKTLAECNNTVSGQNSGSCTVETQDVDGTFGGQTIQQLCAGFASSVVGTILSCGPKTITQTTTTYSGGDVVSLEKKYVIDMDKFGNDLPSALKSHLEFLFGNNYLISASVNTEGQNCTLSDGQSIDKAFARLGRVIDSSHFIRSSICDSSSVNGENLREISERFTRILMNNYPLDLKPMESIKSIHIVKGSQRILLVAGKDYSYAEKTVVLINDTFKDFDSMDVVIQERSLVR